MMDWDKLRIFHSVAEKGSLTHAGEVLHLSQSAVSRQIRALEESLNVTLFHRHARGLILTEQGELLFDATQAMVKRLDATSARIRDSEDEVFGELRVTTTTGFGTLWLAPRLPALYPPPRHLRYWPPPDCRVEGRRPVRAFVQARKSASAELGHRRPWPDAPQRARPRVGPRRHRARAAF